MSFDYVRDPNPDRPKASDYPIEQRGRFYDPSYVERLREQFPDLPPVWRAKCEAPKCGRSLTSNEDLALLGREGLVLLHRDPQCAWAADAKDRLGQPLYHPKNRSTVGALIDDLLSQFEPATVPAVQEASA